MRAFPPLFLGALLSALVALATVLSVRPPPARPLDAPAADFSALRALGHVRALSALPHPVGSAAHESVRDYLLRTLADLGLDARVEETSAALRIAGTTHGARVRNLIARLPGRRGSGPSVLLAAHYDSVPQSRGASDDGAGVATLLETARALAAGDAMQNDVIFLFTDAEEVGSLGAYAFTEEELPALPIGVALNFDARGTRGPAAMYDVSANDGVLVRALAATAPRPVSTSLLGALAHALPNDSDATVFMRAGIPTYAFAFVENLYQYHQYEDSLDALDPRSLQHFGDYALPLARHFGEGALPVPAAANVVYFDVFGAKVVTYSTLLARLLAGVTLVIFGALVRRARRASQVTLRGVFVAGILALLALVAVPVAAMLPHLLLAETADPFALFARPGLACAASVAFGAAAVIGVYARTLRDRSRVNGAEAALGAMGVWGAIVLTLAILAPASSFAFQWPLVVSLVATAYFLPRTRRRSGWVDLAVTASLAPAAFFLGNLGYALFVMMGAGAPELVALVVALAILLAVPALARLGVLELRLLAVGTAAAGLAIAIAAAALSRTARDLPRPDSLAYDYSAADHAAIWFTNDRAHDAYVSQRIGAGLSSAPAPTFDFAAPEIVTRSDDEGDMRRISLDIAVSPHTRCVRLWDDGGEPVRGARLNGKPVPDLVRFSPELDEKLLKLVSGDRSPSRWTLEYCGWAGSLRVELLARRNGGQVKLAGYEVTDGLPGPPPTPRGAGAYPAMDSDATYVSFALSL